MTLFSSTAYPGQRWKMYLPGAASTQSYVLSMSAAAALFRNWWLNAETCPPARTDFGAGCTPVSNRRWAQDEARD
jgi:hypothetical protein